MKSESVRKSIQLAVLMATAAAAAFGQNALVADVQFPFAVKGRTMEPGQYVVTRQIQTSGAGVYSLYNRTTHSGVLITGAILNQYTGKMPATPIIGFKCDAEGGCALSRIWDGSSNEYREFPAGTKRVEKERAYVELAMGRK